MRGAWTGRRVTVVAAFDSFLKSALPYARHLEAQGAELRYRLVLARANQISRAQLDDLGVPASRTRTLPMDTLVTREALESEDVLLVALNGLRSRRLHLRLHRAFVGAPRRPVTVSFYPGLIFRMHLEGMASRMSADLLLLNSPHDLALYEGALASMGLENVNAIALGLSFLPTAREREAHRVPADGPIVFAGQPTVPADRAERRWVLGRLIELARAHPEQRWQLKPRHRRTETTLHPTDHHYEDLLAERGPTPASFEVTHAPMDALLRRASACLTFSSTAALEAVRLGVPTRVLSDVGVHEHVGNHFFIGSGLHGSLDDVAPGLPFVEPAPEWAARHVLAARDHLDVLDARLTELLDRRASTDHPLAPPYPRRFGRSAALERALEAEEGWRAVARFGAGGGSRWTKLRRGLRPLGGTVQDQVARLLDRIRSR